MASKLLLKDDLVVAALFAAKALPIAVVCRTAADHAKPVVLGHLVENTRIQLRNGVAVKDAGPDAGIGRRRSAPPDELGSFRQITPQVAVTGSWRVGVR